MLKVVVDTNVFVSGLRIPGSKPAKLIDLWREGKFNLVVSYEIVEEYLSVLSRPRLKIALKDVREISQYLYMKAEIIKPKRKITVISEDLSDNMFLECGVEGGAEYIVTGDNHLLSLKEFGGIKILSVADFLSLIE